MATATAKATASIYGCGSNTKIFKSAQKSSTLTLKSRPRSCKLTMTMVAPKKTSNFIEKSSLCESSKEDLAAYETLDKWMRESVVEIVKNLCEAPLLVRVYGENGAPRMESEKVVLEDWDLIRRKWETPESEFPEGVIFVEELKEEDCDYGCERDGITKAWGIVVQGRGRKCGPVCYLLKTSRVASSGIGLCCTHFCLLKVRDYREIAQSQFNSCWLL